MRSSTRMPKQSPQPPRPSISKHTHRIDIKQADKPANGEKKLIHLDITPVISSLTKVNANDMERGRSLRLDTRHLARVARAAVPKPSILANSGGVGRKFHQQVGEEKKKIYLVLRHFVFSRIGLGGRVCKIESSPKVKSSVRVRREAVFRLYNFFFLCRDQF
ncbi:hypothetical protein GGI42DRAFT_325271 [Trichoderma sp. SZMC 28013]